VVAAPTALTAEPAVTIPAVATNPTPPTPPAPVQAGPVSLGAPVESGTLNDINPESIGLLSTADGGLGTNLWKGTTRTLIERIAPALELPTASPTLNNLAYRLFASTTSAPDGVFATSNQSLTAMRAEKLVKLGHAQEAWKLILLAKPELVDDATLRKVAEANLASANANEICSKLPELMKAHTDAEWQKLQFVCQFQANDLKAAQLTLDILHTQNVKDDIFFSLAEKNILGAAKSLPRQLTPLTPLTLAILRHLDQPLRNELYAKSDASLIKELLKTKSLEDKAKLELADRAAARGLIDAETLGNIYAGVAFPPESLSTAITSKETGARLRALLYQAALQEKIPQSKIADTIAFMQSGDAALSGSIAQLAASLVADIVPAKEFNSGSDQMVLINAVAGKSDKAMAWLQVAHTATIGMPAITTGLQTLWPILAVSGYVSDKDYAQDMAAWLDTALKNSDARAGRKIAASVLLLLDADGFSVPDDAWVKVTDTPEFEKHLTLASPLLMERLRAAGQNNRRGEAIMYSLVAVNGGNDIPLSMSLGVIRALRAVGLTADAATMTREALLPIIMAPTYVKPDTQAAAPTTTTLVPLAPAALPAIAPVAKVNTLPPLATSPAAGKLPPLKVIGK
jgi:hypothetical protein